MCPDQGLPPDLRDTWPVQVRRLPPEMEPLDSLGTGLVESDANALEPLRCPEPVGVYPAHVSIAAYLVSLACPPS
jgi:hypothetical protein